MTVHGFGTRRNAESFSRETRARSGSRKDCGADNIDDSVGVDHGTWMLMKIEGQLFGTSKEEKEK